MFRRSEADRVARKRQLQKAAQVKMQRKVEARQEKLQKEVTFREMNEEIARILQIFALPQFAALDYPHMEEIIVYKELPLFTSLRFPRTRGAWLISTFEYSWRHDSTGTASVYLLFDGNICVTGHPSIYTVPMSLERLKSDSYYNGRLFSIDFRKLRQKLEASLKRPNNGVSHNEG